MRGIQNQRCNVLAADGDDVSPYNPILLIQWRGQPPELNGTRAPCCRDNQLLWRRARCCGIINNNIL